MGKFTCAQSCECLWRNLNINELLITTFSISPSECRQQHKCGSSSSIELYKFAMVPLVTGQCRFSSALPNKYFSVFRILRVITPHRHPKCQYFLFCTSACTAPSTNCSELVSALQWLTGCHPSRTFPQKCGTFTAFGILWWKKFTFFFFYIYLSDYFSLFFMANYIVSSIPGQRMKRPIRRTGTISVEIHNKLTMFLMTWTSPS